MLPTENWDALYTWLLENEDTLAYEEKQYWIEQLTTQHEKTLELWSERLDLLDEVKEKLLTIAPFSFQKKTEHYKGISFFQLGLYEQAAEVLAEEVHNSVQPARVYLYLGFSFLYLNEGSKAKESFLNVINRSYEDLEKHFAFLGLGLQEGQRQNIEQAILYFEKAEALLFNTDVVYNLGICYLLLEMPEQALPFFKKVITSGDSDAEAYYWLGKCYIETGDRNSGMEIWYQAVQNYDSKELLHTLAVEFEEKELFTGALYCYQRLKDLGSEPAVVLHGIAWNYGLMDEREKSKKSFHELFDYDKTDSNGWISYLWLLIKWDETEAIINVLKEIRTLNIKHPLLQEMTEEIMSKE